MKHFCNSAVSPRQMFVFPVTLLSVAALRWGSKSFCLVANFGAWQLVSSRCALHTHRAVHCTNIALCTAQTSRCALHKHRGFFFIDYSPRVILFCNYAYNYFALFQYAAPCIFYYFVRWPTNGG
jgi:hypothetical protein